MYNVIVVDAVYKLVCGCIKLCFYSFDLEVGNGVAIFMRDVYTAMRAFICALKMQMISLNLTRDVM